MAGYRSQRNASRLAVAIASASREPKPVKPKLFDSRDLAVASVRYHVTFKTRAGNTETGRVTVPANATLSATANRALAIRQACFKYPQAVRASMSAVACGRT